MPRAGCVVGCVSTRTHLPLARVRLVLTLPFLRATVVRARSRQVVALKPTACHSSCRVWSRRARARAFLGAAATRGLIASCHCLPGWLASPVDTFSGARIAGARGRVCVAQTRQRILIRPRPFAPLSLLSVAPRCFVACPVPLSYPARSHCGPSTHQEAFRWPRSNHYRTHLPLLRVARLPVRARARPVRPARGQEPV